MEVRDEYVADVTRYSGPLREGAKDADRFGEANDKAALAVRKMGLAAKEAADKAARAQRDAADAAEKLARGETSVDEAARLAARAENELERASIKAAEAQMAAAKAADRAAANYKQAARDATVAAAASGAGFKKVEQDGIQAADGIASGLGEVNKAWTIGIANSVAMLPQVAAVASDGLVLALGGAIAAIGIKFAAKNAQIREEFGTLGKEISSSLTADAAPFVHTLDDIAQRGEQAFKSWEPEIRSAWADMAPAVDTFVTDALKSLDEFKPAFRDITRAFDTELSALAPTLGGDMHNLATGIDAVAKAAERNPQALASLVTDLTLLVRYGGDAIGFLVRFKSEFDALNSVLTGGGPAGLLHFIDGLGKLGGWLGKITGLSGGAKSSLSGVGGAADRAGTSTDTMVDHTRQLLTAQQAATMSTNQLKQALDNLTGANQNAFDAETQYRQALAAATAAGKANNAGIHGNSAAALQNRAALSQLSQAIKNNIEQGHLNAAQIEVMRQKFIAAAEQMGVSRGEARKLADQLLGVRDAANKIPSKKQLDIMVRTAAARNQIEQFLYWAESQHINIGTSVNTFHGAHGGLVHRAGGGIVQQHLAGGGPSGYVRGPGTTTSDSIITALSDEEFVVNAKQTEKHRGLLEAINAGMDVGGAPIFGARLHPSMLAAMAAQQSLAALRRSPEAAWAAAGLGAGVGSGHGTVVQHVSVTVNVGGSIRSDRDIVAMIQQALLRNRIATSLPAGR